jgi:hypothetical protein
MNEQQPLLLTGVFLPQADYTGFFNYGDAITTPLYIPVLDIQEKLYKRISDGLNRLSKAGN